MATLKNMMAAAKPYMPKESARMVGTINPSGHSMPTQAKAYGLAKTKTRGFNKVGFKGKKVM